MLLRDRPHTVLLCGSWDSLAERTHFVPVYEPKSFLYAQVRSTALQRILRAPYSRVISHKLAVYWSDLLQLSPDDFVDCVPWVSWQETQLLTR